MSLSAEQHATVTRFGATAMETSADSTLGVADSVRTAMSPINGLRHPPEGRTSGWYLWAGGDLPDDPDLFNSLHAEHLAEWCPEVIPYLGLPPGWRFLIADEYEDVWFDPQLLDPQ